MVVARAVENAIVIYEPHTNPDQLKDFSCSLGMGEPSATYIEERMARARYAPVVKFERDGDDNYVALRMTYRGEGGWSWALASGRLPDLVRQLVPPIGTEAEEADVQRKRFSPTS